MKWLLEGAETKEVGILGLNSGNGDAAGCDIVFCGEATPPKVPLLVCVCVRVRVCVKGEKCHLLFDTVLLKTCYVLLSSAPCSVKHLIV